MKTSSIARPAAALLAAFAFFACSKGQPAAAPTPSQSPATSATSAPPAAARAAAGAPFTAMMVAQGDTIFHARTCKNCHGPDGKGAKNGPNLTAGPFLHMPNGRYDEIIAVVTNGVPADSIKDKSHTIPMRPRGGTTPAPLTDDQIRSVAAYVYSLSHP